MPEKSGAIAMHRRDLTKRDRSARRFAAERGKR